MARDQVFLSYSESDQAYLDELLIQLKPFLRGGAIAAWSDLQIQPGSNRLDEVRAAIARTSVAVMLVSPDFLASDFIHEHELGHFLKEAEAGDVTLTWVLIRDCLWGETPLKDYQAIVSPPGKPLAAMPKAERDTAWRKVCEAIKRATNPPDVQRADQHEVEPLTPESVPRTRLRYALVLLLLLLICGLGMYQALTRPDGATPSNRSSAQKSDQPSGKIVEPSPAPQAAVLAGIVVDAESGLGLAGVSLTIQEWENRDGSVPKATTDSDGRFLFPDLRPLDKPGRRVFLLAGKSEYSSSKEYRALGVPHKIELERATSQEKDQ